MVYVFSTVYIIYPDKEKKGKTKRWKNKLTEHTVQNLRNITLYFNALGEPEEKRWKSWALKIVKSMWIYDERERNG